MNKILNHAEDFGGTPFVPGGNGTILDSTQSFKLNSKNFTRQWIRF